MEIELFEELNYDDQKPSILTIEIDEQLPIKDLISHIHKIIKKPMFTELKWDGNVEKIACRYYFKSGPEFGVFEMIEELNRKIADFPKYGTNKKLSILIDGSVGLAN